MPFQVLSLYVCLILISLFVMYVHRVVFFSLFVGFSPSVIQFLGPVGEDLLLLLCWVPVTSPTVKGLHRSLSV